MILSRGKKVALGVVTLLPALFSLAFMFWWFSIIARATSGPDTLVFQSMGKLIALQAVSLILFVALLGVYIYLALKLSDSPQESLIWILVVTLAGYIGQFVFFFVKVWPEHATFAFPVTSPVVSGPLGWHYMYGQTQVGPVSEQSLRALLDLGAVDLQTPAWRPGLSDWATLGQLLGDQQSSYVEPGSDFTWD